MHSEDKSVNMCKYVVTEDTSVLSMIIVYGAYRLLHTYKVFE
jgi:hypothetical protein